MKNILIALTLFWVSQSYFDIDSLVKGMNQLPPERQLESRILVGSHGNWDNIFHLIYRKDDGKPVEKEIVSDPVRARSLR